MNRRVKVAGPRFLGQILRFVSLDLSSRWNLKFPNNTAKYISIVTGLTLSLEKYRKLTSDRHLIAYTKK